MNYCGECEHMKYEDTDGYGWCCAGTRSGLMCYCGDESCLSFAEKEDNKTEETNNIE